MARNKLSSSKKILLASIMIGVVVVAAIISLVVVLAAETQNMASTITITYRAVDVAGDVKFSYSVAGGEFSEPLTASFAASDESVGRLDLSENIELTSTETYVIFKYEITGHSDAGYNVSLEYVDKNEIDTNNTVKYVVSSGELNTFDGLSLAAPVGTITKNNHKNSGETTFLYVRVDIADINQPMQYNGTYNLVISRDVWADPNYDETTGLQFGLIDAGEGEKYAALVDYDGSASEISINTTDVYGEELPVRVIRDYAFANVDPSSMATATPLTKVEIGDAVEQVQGYAFAYNTTLTEAKIGKNVTYLANTAFYGCTGLTKIANMSNINITAAAYNLPASVVISKPLAVYKDTKQFNNRDYYYVEMGEYPQTYAGAATTELSTTGEKFVLDLSVGSTVTPNKEYDIYEDVLGFRYIKHKVNKYSSTNGTYVGGQTITNGEDAYFKIEPIKWDIVGYYNDDKTDFTRASDGDFDPTVSTNLVVTSRTALQAMAWYPTNTDVDYNASSVYKWLRTFENNVLAQYKDTNIQQVSNQYTDSSATTSWSQITGGTATMAGSVEEYAWVMDYTQANTLFASNNERKSSPSDFALATYVYMNTGYDSITRTGTCGSWLRSSYISGSYCNAGDVNLGGSITYSIVRNTNNAVRPALLINL